MALTLKNYTTILAADLLLQAKKNTVRECDESPKGHFVAYVDEGNDSYDVSLTLKGTGEITEHSCECNSTAAICRHKAALMMHIAEGKKPKAVVKVKKKENKVDTLLDEVDTNALKDWVRGLISKNKDIELSLVHYFSVKEQQTPAEVIKIVNDAVKAVAGNKKTIDLTQLKKLVELWTEMLTPIMEQYGANVTDEKSFLNFHTMLETCIAFQFKVDSNSNRIPKFIEEALQKSVEPVGQLQVEGAWDKAVGYFIIQVPDGYNRVRMHYLLHLKNIMTVSSLLRKEKIIDWLAKQLKTSKPDTLMNGSLYRKFIFEITVEGGLFAKYSLLFKPIQFDNDYNKKLIGLLIQLNHLDLAKQYCNEQIKLNYRDEYNVLYLQFLKEIYTLQNNEEELAKVLAVLFPFSFNYDEYLFILQRLPNDEERKKWRTKVLAKSRSHSTSNKTGAAAFFFKLMDGEQGYRKMIEYIDSDTPYQIISQYAENMAAADKNKFIEAILRKSDDYGWTNAREKEQKDATYFPELYQVFIKYYTTDYLKMVIKAKEKDRWFSRSNKFIDYMKEQLLG